ncbi:hypothetical protein D3C72_1327290 [compost metagenome]
MRPDRVFWIVVPIGRRVIFALLHDLNLACKWSHQQTADTAEQPGKRIDNLQWHGQQGIAKRQHRIGITLGDGAREVIGKHQQNCAGTEARSPRAVFFAEENRQQCRDDDRESAAQGIAENEAVEREAQLRQRLIAGARGGALREQVLLRDFDGGKQP